MELKPPFYLREEASSEVRELLEKTSLGTDGARYLHLNTKEIITELDDPLFLSLERNGRALGNITFCRRTGGFWYIRYFAFDALFQTGKRENTPQKTQGFLKHQIEAFFTAKLNEDVRAFYAYIDPKNKRSKWMSENFGFKTIAQIKTQTFSRLKPKRSQRLVNLEDQSLLESKAEHLFYTNHRPKRLKSYALRGEQGEILASLSVQHAHWRIDRMPGKSGKLLVTLLPYIPLVRQIIKPKNHRFLVIESVFVKDQKPQFLNELFESVLAAENQKLLFWWHDSREFPNLPYSNISWGLSHKLIGTPLVDVVARYTDPQLETEAKEKPIFVSGMDLV